MRRAPIPGSAGIGCQQVSKSVGGLPNGLLTPGQLSLMIVASAGPLIQHLSASTIAGHTATHRGAWFGDQPYLGIGVISTPGFSSSSTIIGQRPSPTTL